MEETIVPQGKHWCCRCKQRLPYSAFHKGNTGYCKTCRAAYLRETYKPDLVRERNARYYQKHKEHSMKLSKKMMSVLSQLQVGRTTMFGSTESTNSACGGANYLNANTVQALIRRGLLEPCGEIPSTGHGTYYYRISEAGRQVLLDAGESIIIEMEPYQIDPWLVQKAIELQYQDRMEQWKQQLEQSTSDPS